MQLNNKIWVVLSGICGRINYLFDVQPKQHNNKLDVTAHGVICGIVELKQINE